MKVSNSNDLKKVYDEVQENLTKVTQKEFPWENKDAYLEWLVQTYEYVRFSTRMLALTGGSFPLDKTKYSSRFIAHASEEKGHDRLLVNDVKALGYNINDIESSSAAKAFHYSFYYWSSVGNPMGVFGLLLAVEGFAARNLPNIYKRCLEKYGPKATTFLKVHAEDDPDHLDKIFETVQDANREDLESIGAGTIFYNDCYGNIYKDIMARKSNGQATKKAA